MIFPYRFTNANIPVIRSFDNTTPVNLVYEDFETWFNSIWNGYSQSGIVLENFETFFPQSLADTGTYARRVFENFENS